MSFSAQKEKGAEKRTRKVPVYTSTGLYDGQSVDVSGRVFGVAGASLMSAHNLPEKNRKLGIEGERKVGDLLEAFASAHKNVYVFHSVKLPDHEGDVDHVMVQGSQVLLIDSKNWAKGYNYRAVSVDDAGADIVVRDNAEFPGGRVFLSAYQKEWQALLANSGMRVNAVLTTSTSVNITKESSSASLFVSVDDLNATLEAFFTDDSQAMPASMVEWFARLTQSPKPEITYAIIEDTSERVDMSDTKVNATTYALVAACVLLFVIAIIWFPAVYIGVVPLLYFVFKHKAVVDDRKDKNTLILNTVLGFTFFMLIAALVGGFIVLKSIFGF